METLGIDLSVQRGSEMPVGAQLVWKLRAFIAGGAIQPGQRLPGVRELADAVGVNANTVRSVYQRLEEQGLVSARQGRGTFVADSPPASSELEAIAAEAEARAERLGLDRGDILAAVFVGSDRLADAARHLPTGAQAPPHTVADDERSLRRQLRREIAQLEAELATLEPPTALGDTQARPTAGRLLSARELTATRDELTARVAALARERDQQRRAAIAARAEAERAAQHEQAARLPAWTSAGRSTLKRGGGAPKIAWTAF
jgi:DNA-binding transcriptional regulator YhcF (GntR family)